MENRESIFIDVQIDAAKVQSELNGVLSKIADLKKRQKELNAEYKASNISEEEYLKNMNAIKDEMGALNKQTASLSAATRLANQETKQYGDSLNEQRRLLSDLTKVYDGMSKAERESAQGLALQKHIQEQTAAVVELEQATGRSQRLVGSYEDALNKTLGKFGVSLVDLKEKGMGAFSGLGDGVKAFGKLFITPPIAVVTAILSAIVFAAQKLSAAFKKNDDAGTALAKGLAALAPIGEAINKMFDKLAVGIGKVAEKVGAFVGKIFGEASESAVKYVDDLDKLEDKEREYAEKSSERAVKISDLRNKAVQKEKYNTEERIGFLREAIGLEEKDLEERKKIAEEKLRLLEEEARRTSDSSDAMKDKITQAKVEVNNATKDFNQGTMRLQAQLNNMIKEERAKDVADFKAKQKEKEDALKASIALQKQIHQNLEDFQIELIEDEQERAYKSAKVRGEREIEALKEKLKTEKNLTEQAHKELNSLIELKEKKLQDDLLKIDKDFEDKRAAADMKRAEDELKRRLELASMVADRLLENENANTQDKLDALKDEYDLRRQLLKSELDRELELIGANEEQKRIAREIYKETLLQMERDYEDARLDILQQGAEREVEIFNKWAGDVAMKSAIVRDSLQGMQRDMKTLGIESKALAIAQKAAAMVNVISTQAIAIANGAAAIASGIKSAAGVPFPYNIAAIASVVAQIGVVMGTVISTIAQAKSLLGGGGGGGDFNVDSGGGGSSSGGGSYASGGGGSTSVAVSGGNVASGNQQVGYIQSAMEGAQIGELNAKVGSLNYAFVGSGAGFDYDKLSQIITSSLQSMPAPILDYQEFVDFEKRQVTIKNL